MTARANRPLLVAGALSALAALLHIGVIFGGPDWYRFFGAGEEMAQMAAKGDPYPAIVTVFIASVLFTWAAYAFAGAGLIRRLPLMRTALTAITAVYLIRSLAPLGLWLFALGPVTPFWIWSSAICFGYGLAYLIGTRRAWQGLSA
ncbi:hypothetical protein [Kordiimonas marina]|uniref:hypothetical protein n=1 Tax=Kordiimonas marina TaxID=2872312 RepID=UPI001FF131B4|nr:hypothetical protein [Kordiimonas marina]MCJ9428631.1 hypothetical protein [Kordiimonas marina]